MIGFPLLLIPFAIYNIFVFLMPGVAFTTPIIGVALMSGVTWTPTFGDALLALGMFLLLLEMVKASRPGARYLTDHLLSLIVLGAAAAQFLLLPPFGTSTFLLLTVLMAVEFLAGVSIGFRNRHRRVQPAAPAGAAHETAPVGTAPVVRAEPEAVPASTRLAPSEPSSDRVYPAQAEPVFERAPQARVPEPRIEPQPEAEPVKPPPAAIHEAVEPAPAPNNAVVSGPERKIADWSVADLVSDQEPEAKPKIHPKP